MECANKDISESSAWVARSALMCAVNLCTGVGLESAVNEGLTNSQADLIASLGQTPIMNRGDNGYGLKCPPSRVL